jgi:SAM-dependent MidA family methyltransferase
MRIDLPEPGPDERAHGERVAAYLRAEIAASGGAIDFARFMEIALYAPGLGYYSAGSAKFGAAGDFVTAPELGDVFARCLARALAPVLRDTGGDVLEIGPGSGALAAALLAELGRLDALPEHYRLLERSADLRQRQQQAVAHTCPQLLDRVQWLEAPPAQPWRGVLLGNEVLDALPVQLFALHDDGLRVRTVGVDDAGRFQWRERAADAALATAVEHALGARRAALPRPYASEICTLLPPWLLAVTRSLVHGAVFFADYGYRRDRYYAPERREGTLRCHFRHRAHDDPLILAGLQDITAWVDFDALEDAGRGAGLACTMDLTQAQFLVAHGLDEVFAAAHAQAAGETERYRLAQEVKQLTLPTAMGERFRVLQFRRDPALQ